MKQGTGFMKRSLALLLVAIMVATNLSGLTLPVRAAADNDVTVSEGQIVAGNYELTAAEKELLKSGLLVGGSITYCAPTDSELITINTEEKTITVGAYTDKHGNEWVATEAFIVFDDGEEKVTLTDGTGNYAYDGNAFSVKATYVLNVNVDTALQETLLGAAAILKQGIANLDTVAAQAGNLFILEQAMPALVDLANNGVSTPLGPATLDNACKFAILGLNDQMTANGGKLKLSTMIEQLEAGSKSEYMLTNGAAMQAESVALAEELSLIASLLNQLYNDLSWLISNGYVDQTTANQIKTLANVTGDLAAALEGVNADPWTAANSGTSIVVGTDYAKLDTLIGALGETSTVTVKNPLFVASAEIQQNMSMFNVTVNVVLETVQNNVVAEYGKRTVVLTLAADATADDILAAVQEAGIEDEALATWVGVYLSEHYAGSATALPETLTEDIEYTITYSPVNYTVTIAGEAAEYPYGYVLTLPNHPENGKAYDYYMNGSYYSQGTKLAVTGDMTFTRDEGKSYSTGNLLAIIAGNYGTEKIASILNSGALKIDETINYREPTKAELETLVKLEDNTLTVQPYASSYEGLNWVPYTYVVDGEVNYFNGATTVELGNDFMTVNVYYRLVMTNFTSNDVKDILDLVKTLVAEAEDQKRVMDKLAGYEGQMGELTKNLLNGLNGVIGGYSTANGGGLHDDPATNDELVAFYQATIADLITNCIAANGKLNLYNIILSYNDPNNGGLIYYYQNYETILGEVEALAGYLGEMLDGGDRQAALEKLMADNGYEQYIDVLSGLKEKLDDISATLKPVNAAINTGNTAKLSALVKALTAEGSVEYTEYGSPYIEMGPVVRTATRFVTVEVKVNFGGKSETFTVTIEKGTALTQAHVNELKGKIEAAVANYNQYYTNDYAAGAELDALVGVVLTSGMNFNYSWTVREYVVHIPGENDQTVTVENLTIDLPAHPNGAAGMSYEYTIGGQTVNSGIYTFNKSDLDTLFVNGELTITRVERNASVDQLENMVNNIDGMELVGENGNYTGIVANVAANNLMNLMMDLVLNSGYGYIGLDGQNFVYTNDKSELELSIQAMIDALLNDSTFTSEALIEMGSNGGTLLNTKIQLGSSASEFIELDFTINFTGSMGAVAEALKSMEKYLTFKANNGVLEFQINLPDKVYGAYLTALVATGHLDKADANSIDQAIAFQFMCDYLTAVMESKADMTTLQNTLEMLGKELSLEEYNKYYSAFVDAMDYEIVDNRITLKTNGKQTINGLLKLLNTQVPDNTLGLIKEYKDGGEIVVTAAVNMNEGREYCALILDAQASGVTNKFECIRKGDLAGLNAQTSALAGYSFVILLDDVDGNITVSGTTILDLNGHDVNGTINGTGNLFIIDSSLDTYNAGKVEGVSGNVTVIAGNYASDVSAFLKAGYHMDGTTVRNSMYYIKADDAGNVKFVLNGDVYKDIPNVTAVALDMATELLLNYAISASMTINGNEIYAVEFEDLLGLLKSSTRVGDAMDMLLEVVDFPAVSNMINTLLDDMLNFNKIYTALENNEPIVTYPVVIAPWMVEVAHVEDGDYLTLNIVPNEELEKSFTISFAVEGNSVEYVKDLAEELKEIVDADINVNITNPYREGKDVYISAAGSAIVTIDMSNNEDYAIFLSIILAYANNDKRSDVAEAVNNGDIAALKDVVDNTTVAELFKALKKLSRNLKLQAMADVVGVTADISTAVELEDVFHLILVGTGKVLEEMDIVGRNSKLGGLYNEQTGFYELTKANMFRDGEVTVRTYGANYEVSITELTLRVKLFGELEEPECQHNYQGVVTEPGCETEGFTTYTCTICGDTYDADFVPALGHDYADATCGVAATCQRCGQVSGDPLDHIFTNYVSDNNASCTANGTETAVCDRCGVETDTREVPNSVLPHIGAGYWAYDEEYHWRYCQVCSQRIEYNEHDWQKIDPNADCTNATVILYFCDCGATKQEVVDPAGHQYIEIVYEPTCSEIGYTVHYCVVCMDYYVDSYVDPVGHNFVRSDETKNATCTEDGYVVYKCVYCDHSYNEVLPALGHKWGEWYEVSAPTCTENGTMSRVCMRCACIDSYETDALGHVYETVVTEPTCTEQGFTTYTCTVCGYTFDADFVEANGHAYEGVVTEPTCTENGYTTYTCSVCGDTYVDDIIEVTGHAYEAVVTAPTCTEEGYTTYTCSVCGDSYVDDIVEAKGHEFEAVVTAPTCTEEGYTTYTCTVCGYTYDADFVEAAGHAYEAVVTAPTCTEGGFTTYTCSVCGDSYVADYTEAAGHAYEAVVTAPTCVEEGYTTYTCSVCGDTYVADFVEASGHAYEAVVTAPTCVEEGYTTYTCSVCGDSYVADYTDALGHSYEGVVTEPTCTERGYTTYTCSVCGASYVADYTDALGHSYVGVVTEPTCTEGGFTTYTCSVCGASYIADQIPAKGHTYDAVVTDPTCTEVGYTTYTCSVCGDTYVSDYVEALGHEMGEWYKVEDATCDGNGTERRDCAHCDYFETREVVAFGHSYEAVVTAPTCTEQGYTTYTCPTCGDGYVADFTDALGHTWGEWVVVREAQCHTAGVTGLNERTCSVCGEVESEEVPTTDHVFVDGVCKWCGFEEAPLPPTGMIAMGGVLFLLVTAGMGCIILFVRRKSLLN